MSEISGSKYLTCRTRSGKSIEYYAYENYSDDYTRKKRESKLESSIARTSDSTDCHSDPLFVKVPVRFSALKRTRLYYKAQETPESGWMISISLIIGLTLRKSRPVRRLGRLGIHNFDHC